MKDRTEKIHTQYEQAVTNGQIDPNNVDIERFADIIATDIEYLDVPSVDIGSERIASERSVAHLMKGGERRKEVIDKWFGKDTENHEKSRE